MFLGSRAQHRSCQVMADYTKSWPCTCLMPDPGELSMRLPGGIVWANGPQDEGAEEEKGDGYAMITARIIFETS